MVYRYLPWLICHYFISVLSRNQSRQEISSSPWFWLRSCSKSFFLVFCALWKVGGKPVRVQVTRPDKYFPLSVIVMCYHHLTLEKTLNIDLLKLRRPFNSLMLTTKFRLPPPNFMIRRRGLVFYDWECLITPQRKCKLRLYAWTSKCPTMSQSEMKLTAGLSRIIHFTYSQAYRKTELWSNP